MSFYDLWFPQRSRFRILFAHDASCQHLSHSTRHDLTSIPRERSIPFSHEILCILSHVCDCVVSNRTPTSKNDESALTPKWWAHYSIAGHRRLGVRYNGFEIGNTSVGRTWMNRRRPDSMTMTCKGCCDASLSLRPLLLISAVRLLQFRVKACCYHSQCQNNNSWHIVPIWKVVSR